MELLQFATARMGKKAIEAVDIELVQGGRQLFDGLTWRIAPGQRLGLVGINGAGKSTLLRVLAGELAPSAGGVDTGTTVRLAWLQQEVPPVRGDLTVLESLAEVRQRTQTAAGEELTASSLCDRFGFRGGRQQARVSDLSGGERRRLQLMRLLMGEPNVLLLDEPTNDLDIETLTALEDLLDRWPGTLIVVSHDRYFTERVCDDVYALDGRGGLRHLPGGIVQYLEERPGAGASTASAAAASGDARGATDAPPASGPSGAERHAARKESARLERLMERLAAEEASLQEQMAEQATDPSALAGLTDQLQALREEREAAEASWLELAELLEA